MKTLLLSFPLLWLAASAQAGERCTTFPVQQRIAHGVYLQQVVLRCETDAPTEQDPVQHARDWLALCQEAGGTVAGCAAGYAVREAPAARDALVVARAERAASLEPIASPVAAAEAAPLRWQTPRLLTNR